MARGLRVVLFVLLLAALAGSAYHARSGVKALADARQASATAHRRLQVLDERLTALEARRAYAKRVNALLARADRLELDRERWSERRIHFSRDQVPRDRAVDLLGTTVSGNRSIFIPDAFELSVLRPGQGLFRRPAWENRSVNLELSGTLHLLLEDSPR